MPEWVAVAHLPSCKIRSILHKWSVEVPRAIMPNRQRTPRSFFTAAGARAPSAPAPLPAPAAASEATAPDQNSADGSEQTDVLRFRCSMRARVPQAGMRRQRLRHVAVVATSAKCRCRGERNRSRTHCAVRHREFRPRREVFLRGVAQVHLGGGGLYDKLDIHRSSLLC